MNGVRYVGSLTLAILCAGMFAAYAGVSLDLSLQLAILLGLAVSVGVSIPDLALQIQTAIQLNAGIQLALEVGVRSVTADLGLSINAQLAVVLALVAAVKLVLALGSASLVAYTYQGPGEQLGPALTSSVGSQLPDGTPAPSDVTALVFAATNGGTFPEGTLASLQLLGGGTLYERGLCSVSLSGNASATPAINPSTGAITGLTIGSHGSGYVLPPTVTISDTVPLEGASNATPIIITLADTTDLTTVTIADAKGNGAVNGRFCAKVLTPTTAALYEDGGFTRPVAGSGVWEAGTGTVTGNGSSAAAVPIMGGGAFGQLRGFFNGLEFAPGLQPAGSITLAGICPGSFGLLGDLLDELELEAEMLGTAKLNFGVVPPTVGGNIEIVGGIDATLKNALEFFPPLPSIQANLLATVNGRAALIGQMVVAIGAQLGLSTEKLEVLSYAGPGDQFGSSLGSSLAAGWKDGTSAGSDVQAVVLVATSPGASLALSTFFGGA